MYNHQSQEASQTATSHNATAYSGLKERGSVKDRWLVEVGGRKGALLVADVR